MCVPNKIKKSKLSTGKKGKEIGHTNTHTRRQQKVLRSIFFQKRRWARLEPLNCGHNTTKKKKDAKRQRQRDLNPRLWRLESSALVPLSQNNNNNKVIICYLREANFQNPRSPSSGATPVLSPGIARAAVWAGRGTVARPRGVGWRLGAAGVENLLFNWSKQKMKNGIITMTTEQHYIIRIVDRHSLCSLFLLSVF